MTHANFGGLVPPVTRASTDAEFVEAKKGKLAPGYFCRSGSSRRDLTRAKTSDICTTRMLRTVVGEETVHVDD